MIRYSFFSFHHHTSTIVIGSISLPVLGRLSWLRLTAVAWGRGHGAAAAAGQLQCTVLGSGSNWSVCIQVTEICRKALAVICDAHITYRDIRPYICNDLLCILFDITILLELISL